MREIDMDGFVRSCKRLTLWAWLNAAGKGTSRLTVRRHLWLRLSGTCVCTHTSEWRQDLLHLRPIGIRIGTLETGSRSYLQLGVAGEGMESRRFRLRGSGKRTGCREVSRCLRL